MCKNGALHHVCGVLCCQTALTSRISFVVPPSLSLFLATCESCTYSIQASPRRPWSVNLLAKLSSRLTVALCGIACNLLSHALHRITLKGSQQTSHCAKNSSSTLAFSLPGSNYIESRPHWFPVWSFPLEHIHLSGCRVAQFQPTSTCLLHWLTSGIV